MHWPVRLSNFAGSASLALGTLVLLGWHLHEPALIQVNPAFVPMQYNTALGFALGGLALLSLAWSWPRAATVLGFAVLLVGVLTLIEYIFGLDLHIDQLFMRHYIDVETSHPGRMAPNTALCFSLTGLASLITALRQRHPRTPTWTATFGAIIIGLGIVALAGYIIGMESAYGWGHLTRMAIHTAAGFIILGFGFLALAWAWGRCLQAKERLPRWLPSVIGITGFTITFTMWQALVAQEQRLINEMGAHAANYADESLLIFGLLLTLVLATKARTGGKAALSVSKKTSAVRAPHVVIALGALLAFSLYSLLKSNFESSVRLRFESEVRNHVETIERGIEAYIETLYNIRSEFDALSFVDRNQFRRLTARDLQRLPGIMALEWVPLVPDHERETMEALAREEVSADFLFGDNPGLEGMTAAPQREQYFPIYYVEPLAPNMPVLGFDLATRPGYYAALMRAARTNTPVVSSRLQLYQSAEGAYSVFVALPVYRKDLPLDTIGKRELALRGFAVMATEIGPMLEAILDDNTSPAGLSLTFEDTGAGDEKAFMFRHISRKLDLGPENRETDFLDDGLISSTTLAFADRRWQVTAHAANQKIYPAWNANNLWLPLGLLLLSFGLAYFLYRIKLAESELAESRERFELAMKAGDLGLWDWQLKSGELFINDGWAEMIGYAKDEISNNIDEWSKRLHPDDTDVTMAAFNDYVNDRTVFFQPEFRFRAKDGGYRWILSIGKTIERNEQGNPLRMIGIHMDITERKRMEAELAKSKQEADASNRAKSAFLANMSHELRTPMNAILGYSEMLVEEAEDTGQDDFIPDLKKINQAGNHLLTLINDVLDLSKIESGKLEAFAETFDVGALLDQISGTAQPLMTKNTNHLTLQLGDNLGKACQDLTKLRQALLNLLSNAAKFSHDGAITLQAERQAQADGDWLIFSVSDTGIGIAANKLVHVFEEFSQADNSTTRDYGGTGLGLTISRRFCQMLGGDLSATSQLGVGSTFTIRLPAILPGAEAPREASPRPSTENVHASGDDRHTGYKDA